MIVPIFFFSLEIMKEDNIRLKKQLEEMEAERNQAIHERNGLKQQCTAAIRQVHNYDQKSFSPQGCCFASLKD